MPSRTFRITLSLLSALLLSAAWYAHLGFLIFLAFVPLLLLEQNIRDTEVRHSRSKLFRYAFLSFLIWNILVTWWIVYASFGGACMAILGNTLLMSVVFVIYSAFRSKIKLYSSVWLLIPVWIAWEHIHTLWDITWPWLTLGNVFAFHHRWVQWYEFTGASGGTAWILLVNILAFRCIHKFRTKKVLSGPVIVLASAIIVPILISYAIYFSRQNKLASTPLETVVVQPNIDPYNEKFTSGYSGQFKKVLELIKGQITSETKYLVLPETFITGENGDLNEEGLNHLPEIDLFRTELLNNFPRLKIVTGASTYKFYYHEKDYTATSREHKSSGYRYDAFNTGIFINGNSVEIYHKSKLVPGVEKMPFPIVFKHLEGLAINLGGTAGSLGVQKDRSVFHDAENKTAIAPVICYESIYADYVAEYVRKGASLIFIITNDGWWDDTPGYKHHLNYGRLRAIENRRQIARSANTGISCFIDELGNIYQPTDWWVPAVIKQNIRPNNELTFFSKYGDLISYNSVAFCAVLILFLIFRAIMNVSFNRKNAK